MRPTDTFLCDRISSASRGDQDALCDLFDALHGEVYHVAYRLLGDDGRAEEVAADTFVRLWRSAATFDAERASARAWIATIARRCAIDELRRPKHEAGAPDVAPRDELLDPAPSPLQTRIAGERQRVVRTAVDRLATEQRRAIAFTYFAGLSHSEAASALGHPLGTVKTRVRAALRILKDDLAELGEGAA